MSRGIKGRVKISKKVGLEIGLGRERYIYIYRERERERERERGERTFCIRRSSRTI
jgi:hypothetical protein